MKSTKSLIIQLGDELLRSKGYNAFSYSDISKSLGVKNAAIHYHFPTKPDLAKAVVEWHIQSFENFVDRVQDKSEPDQIKNFLNFYTAIQSSGKVCLIGAVATDWNSLDYLVQKEITKFTAKVLTWLEETLRSGKEKNLLTFSESEKTEGLKILTNIFAGAQLARITGSQDFIAVKQSILEQLIK